MKKSKIRIELTGKALTNQTGLSIISEFLNSSEFCNKIKEVSKIKRNSTAISDYDIIKTMTALLCSGHTSFESVEQYLKYKYFKKILNPICYFTHEKVH